MVRALTAIPAIKRIDFLSMDDSAKAASCMRRVTHTIAAIGIRNVHSGNGVSSAAAIAPDSSDGM